MGLRAELAPALRWPRVVACAVAVGGASAIVAAGGGPVHGQAGMGAVPRFVEETSESGFAHVYDGGAVFAVGGGVAVFDCDQDGLADVYVAGGSNPAALFRNTSASGGELRFARVQADATDLSGVNGAYPLDVDGDGFGDLVVLRTGPSMLLWGRGDCQFERDDAAFPGLRDAAWSNAFSATWESGQTLPTLAFGRYLRLDAQGEIDRNYECDTSVLVRPSAAGTTLAGSATVAGAGLLAAYAEPFALAPGYCPLSMLFSDWDRSGRRDLRVTNDRQYFVDGEDQLWRVAAGEQPRLYMSAEGWVSMQIWGMGIASHDLTGDGLPEVFLTSQGDNKLQTLALGREQPRYRDIALRRGVTLAQPFVGGDVLPSTAWHAEFQDVNNDGLIDLFVAKGNVSAMPDYARRDPSNLLLGQPDGTFREVADQAGILNFFRARGAALADLNADGLLDLIEVNYGEPTRVWRNTGAGDGVANGHWLDVRLLQSGMPNRDAIGAWIEVRTDQATMTRELTVGGGHAGGQLGWTHFGLGGASTAQVRVQWPDGEVGPWQTLTGDQRVVVERSSGRR